MFIAEFLQASYLPVKEWRNDDNRQFTQELCKVILSHVNNRMKRLNIDQIRVILNETKAEFSIISKSMLS